MSATKKPLAMLINNSSLKISEIQFVKKSDKVSNSKLAPKRYTVAELRELNHGQGSPQGVWPEFVFEADEHSPPDTPNADETEWSVINTPFTAPARLHQREPMHTPMRAKTPSTKVKTQETDKRRLGQRAKQVLYGKSTLGYRLCRILSATDEDVPNDLPRTPRESQKCSKRCWDAQVREWRVKLHAYDPKTVDEWRVAYHLFPKETLELAAALDKNATQFCSTGQCLPPADILEEARAQAARAPVARSLNMDDEDGHEDEQDDDSSNVSIVTSNINKLLADTTP